VNLPKKQVDANAPFSIWKLLSRIQPPLMPYPYPLQFTFYFQLCIINQQWSSNHVNKRAEPKSLMSRIVKRNIMATNSVSLHRVLKAAPEKVYKAFTDPIALASWLPPYGFLCSVQEFEPKVGGAFKMTFHNFSTGNAHSFGGNYVEVKPNEYLRYTDKFDDPNMPGEMTTSVSFRKVIAGTEIKIQQDGIPEVIPAEMCYLGWQESLDKLMRLVEPVIPDGA
jgi:uncharacterized protein YndB with AHSA1/START domain